LPAREARGDSAGTRRRHSGAPPCIRRVRGARTRRRSGDAKRARARHRSSSGASRTAGRPQRPHVSP
jgi:hypothetical protein